MIIRGLTLYQPHASLVALGQKPYHTRKRKLPDGIDLLAIHASDTLDWDPFHGPDRKYYLEALGLSGSASGLDIGSALPSDAILCVCRTAPSLLCDGANPPCPGNYKQRGNRYRIFGDFSKGRYAWPLEPILICEPPIECKGAAGLWKLPPEIERILLSRCQHHFASSAAQIVPTL